VSADPDRYIVALGRARRVQSAFRPDEIVRSIRNRSKFKKLEKNPIEKVYQLFRILL